MNFKKTYLLIFALTLAVATSAQRHRTRRTTPKTDTLSLVMAYTDSLNSLRQRIDTTTYGDAYAGQFYRLFVPTTFYHSAIGGRFGMADGGGDAAQTAVDSTLMYIYTHRPDLVSSTESRLKKVGSIRNDIDRPMKPDVEMVDRIDFLPEDEPEVAPVDIMIQKPKFWTYSGDGYLQFLQNYVSGNWYKGGESNYSMVGQVTLNANFNNKSRLKFDNKLELKLGFQTSRGDTVHKFKTNNDLIRYTGKLGLQATKKWYYTLQVLAYTQFTQGLKSNNEKVYSDFMSPFNLNLGIGMDYTVEALNKRLKGTVNLAPFSFNFRYVDRKGLASSYGIKGDHHTLEDFGSQVTADVTWTITDQVKWKSRLYFYTTYERTELEWENTFTLAVSRYISANIFLYPRFDDSDDRDDKLGYWQFKEYSSLGFSYSF